jgi:hypothetical protein
MSFAFSALDILSAIETASQLLDPEMRQFHQRLQELRLILGGLLEAYEPTGLQYVFLRGALIGSDGPK